MHERSGSHRRRTSERRELVVHRCRVRCGIRCRTVPEESVAVIAPFSEFGLVGNTGALILALLIGIAFGWFLERSGMGSAKKLAAQFYLRDLTVFKVMFTAILTAMLGVFWL